MAGRSKHLRCSPTGWSYHAESSKPPLALPRVDFWRCPGRGSQPVLDSGTSGWCPLTRSRSPPRIKIDRDSSGQGSIDSIICGALVEGQNNHVFCGLSGGSKIWKVGSKNAKEAPTQERGFAERAARVPLLAHEVKLDSRNKNHDTRIMYTKRNMRREIMNQQTEKQR